MPRSYLACLSVVVEMDTCEVANPTEGREVRHHGVIRHDGLLQTHKTHATFEEVRSRGAWID